jgi:PKD repeat protein
VQFTEQSTGTAPLTYAWDFTNDGSTDSTVKSPSFTYKTAGTYTVKLTVTNADGSDSEIKTNYISVSSLQTGECYGAETCNPTGNPIGGGPGYTRILTSGTYTVTSLSQLKAALKTVRSGDVIFIPGTATIDLTGETSSIIIPGGVTLASDRGRSGSAGGLIKRDSAGSMPQGSIKTGGDNVRITGLRIQGPHPTYNGNYGDSVKGAIESYDHTNLEVDNCEIYSWSYCGVMSENSISGMYLYVHHNYIHNIAGKGYGYGAGIARGHALFEANRFDYTRHAITGNGRVGESYEARYNVHGSHNLDSNYDLHATDASDHTMNIATWDGHTPSGRLYKIHHNTVPAAVDGYESIFYVAPPTEGMYIYNNRLGSGIRPYGGWTRTYMTNNYVGGVFHASGQ